MSSNVRLVQWIRVFMMGGAVMVPGLPLFLKVRGSSIYAMELWFALAMMCTLVPTGMLARRIGEKRVLLLGAALMLCGPLTYLIADSYAMFVFAEICIGAGLGCVFGCDEAILHKSLTSKDAQEQFQRQWAWTVLLQILFVSLCFYAGGFLSQLDDRFPFLLALANYLVLVLAVGRLREPKQAADYKSDWAGFFCALQRSPGLRWMIAVYACFLALIRTSFWTYESYFAEARSPYHHGTVLAVGALISALCISRGNWLRKRLSLPVFTGILGGGLSTSLLCMGIFVAPWCFILVVCQQIASGYVQSVYASELHRFIDEEHSGLRAAIASFRQMSFLICYTMVLLAVHAAEHFSSAAILIGLSIATLCSSILLVVISRKECSLH